MDLVLIRNKEIRRKSFATGFKLLMIGSMVSLSQLARPTFFGTKPLELMVYSVLHI